jgi:hypothetical protein
MKSGANRLEDMLLTARLVNKYGAVDVVRGLTAAIILKLDWTRLIHGFGTCYKRSEVVEIKETS